jgi:hypothetical protein
MNVGEMIEILSKYPMDCEIFVLVHGNPVIAQRDVNRIPMVVIYGDNGDLIGENPLTEEEYERVSARFLALQSIGYKYTTAHGDHRLYRDDGDKHATKYGVHFDPRIIERMVKEKLISIPLEEIKRVRFFEKTKSPG